MVRSTLLKTQLRMQDMPRDELGNITTTPSVVVTTLKDILDDGNLDTIALTRGGMAYLPKDGATGDGVTIITAATE